MSKFLPINGAVVANAFYVDNALAAKDVAMTLPEVTPETVDVQAMGTLTLPLWPRVSNMQLTVTKVGVDKGYRSMMAAKAVNLEARWAQTVTDSDGNSSVKGVKAFMKGSPSSIPGIGSTPGSSSDNDIVYNLTRYELVIDGAEVCCIDRLAGICRIAGVDYAAALNNLL